MSINQTVDQVLEQTRELQQSISDALNKATDQLKPQVENSLHVARELQSTLIKYAEASSELTINNWTAAVHHLQDFLSMGEGAAMDSAEQLRQAAKKMLEQSRKVTEAAFAAAGTAVGSAKAEDAPKEP